VHQVVLAALAVQPMVGPVLQAATERPAEQAAAVVQPLEALAEEIITVTRQQEAHQIVTHKEEQAVAAAQQQAVAAAQQQAVAAAQQQADQVPHQAQQQADQVPQARLQVQQLAVQQQAEQVPHQVQQLVEQGLAVSAVQHQVDQELVDLERVEMQLVPQQVELQQVELRMVEIQLAEVRLVVPRQEDQALEQPVLVVQALEHPVTVVQEEQVELEPVGLLAAEQAQEGLLIRFQSVLAV